MSNGIFTDCELSSENHQELQLLYVFTIVPYTLLRTPICGDPWTPSTGEKILQTWGTGKEATEFYFGKYGKPTLNYSSMPIKDSLQKYQLLSQFPKSNKI